MTASLKCQLADENHVCPGHQLFPDLGSSQHLARSAGLTVRSDAPGAGLAARMVRVINGYGTVSGWHYCAYSGPGPAGQPGADSGRAGHCGQPWHFHDFCLAAGAGFPAAVCDPADPVADDQQPLCLYYQFHPVHGAALS